MKKKKCSSSSSLRSFYRVTGVLPLTPGDMALEVADKSLKAFNSLKTVAIRFSNKDSIKRRTIITEQAEMGSESDGRRGWLACTMMDGWYELTATHTRCSARLASERMPAWIKEWMFVPRSVGERAEQH